MSVQPYCGAVGVSHGVRPLCDLVTEGVDVLQRPVGSAVGPRVDARLDPRGPGEGLHLGVAVASAAATAETSRPRAVEADHAAVENVLADVQQDVVGQVERQMR